MALHTREWLDGEATAAVANRDFFTRGSLCSRQSLV